jgi:hypothetical protein
MTDFADAFNRGQEAAVRATQARAEVDEVFANAAKELFDVTDGKLELARQRFKIPVKRTLADLVAGSAMKALLDPIPAETEPWLAARNPKAIDAEWIKLAKFERPQEGYPCLLRYDNRDVRCHDQDSLAEAIAELLASAWAGEKLRELVARPLKPVTDDASES